MKKYEFEDAETERERFIELLKRFGGIKGLAEELDVLEPMIRYFMKRNEITEEDVEKIVNGEEIKKRNPNPPSPKQQLEDEINRKVKKEEDALISEKPRVPEGVEYENKIGEDDGVDKLEEFTDYYVIRAKGKAPIFFTKDQEREFREMYCAGNSQDQLSLNACARELGMTRNELQTCKRVLGITHDSSQFTKQELSENDIEELSEKALQRKDKRLAEKIRDKEYKRAIRENKKYKKEEYLLDKKVDKIIEEIGDIDYRPPSFYKPEIKDLNKTLVVNISDWHRGKLIINSQVLVDNEYNKREYEKRKDKFLKDVINLIKTYNPEKIMVLNYGDGPDGPIPDVYEGQADNQDIKYEEQLLGYAIDIKDFILGIHDYQPNIYYSSVPGNHSKANFNWDYLANKTVNTMLYEYDNIEFNVQKAPFKVNEIYDYYLIQTHGKELSKRMETPTAQKEALGIISLKSLPPRKTYICQGHLHHRTEEGPSYRRIMLPSMCGGDDLSSNKMQTGSRPAQTTFLFEEDSGMKAEFYTFFD